MMINTLLNSGKAGRIERSLRLYDIFQKNPCISFFTCGKAGRIERSLRLCLENNFLFSSDVKELDLWKSRQDREIIKTIFIDTIISSPPFFVKEWKSRPDREIIIVCGPHMASSFKGMARTGAFYFRGAPGVYALKYRI